MVPYVGYAQDFGLPERRRGRGTSARRGGNWPIAGGPHSGGPAEDAGRPRGAAEDLPQPRTRTWRRRSVQQVEFRRSPPARHGRPVVALIVDAGALYAQADADEPRHASVVEVLKSERETLVTTELAVAEADYLILDRLGIDVELAFLDDLAEGTFVTECLTRS